MGFELVTESDHFNVVGDLRNGAKNSLLRVSQPPVDESVVHKMAHQPGIHNEPIFISLPSLKNLTGAQSPGKWVGAIIPVNHKLTKLLPSLYTIYIRRDAMTGFNSCKIGIHYVWTLN